MSSRTFPPSPGNASRSPASRKNLRVGFSDEVDRILVPVPDRPPPPEPDTPGNVVGCAGSQDETSNAGGAAAAGTRPPERTLSSSSSSGSSPGSLDKRLRTVDLRPARKQQHVFVRAKSSSSSSAGLVAGGPPAGGGKTPAHHPARGAADAARRPRPGRGAADAALAGAVLVPDAVRAKSSSSSSAGLVAGGGVNTPAML